MPLTFTATVRFGLALVLALVVVLAGLPATGVASTLLQTELEPASETGAPVETSIVVLEEGTDPVAAAAAIGVVPEEVYQDVITGFAAELTPGAAAAARASRFVRKIAPDGRVQAEAQETPTGVARIGKRLEGRRAKRLVNADVAVLDSGVAKHSDLNVVGGKACNGEDPYADRFDHGTAVAGVVGAINNGDGVVGVAPGARIWSVKVLDASGVGKWSQVLCGLDWVHRHQKTIDVVTMSLSGRGKDGACNSMPLHQAVCRVVRAKIPVVVAAGNQSDDAATRIPAAWDQVITVSAFADSNGTIPPAAKLTCDGNDDDAWWTYSNFGADIDIAAPGSCILSLTSSGGLSRSSGTSFAAPHVAGALALFKAKNPSASVKKVRGWLFRESARPQDSDVGFDDDPDWTDYPEPVLWLGK